MRFAQRGGSVNPESEQQIVYFEGATAEELVGKISDMVTRYAIRVVAQTAWCRPTTLALLGAHYAMVTFEEEPQEGLGY